MAAKWRCVSCEMMLLATMVFPPGLVFPTSIAHPRGRYTRTLTRLLEQLFLPVAPEPRERKRMLIPPAPREQTEEVALPWRRS